MLFLFLLTGSAFIFLLSAVPRLPTSLLAPVPPLVALPYIFTYLSVTGKAHLITRENHSLRMLDYPFDNVLFRPQTICRTCNLAKPARSKHCGFCGVCVAKCDHHCPWVNNCLGRGNYRHFLALLLSIGALELYGAYLSYWLLRPYLKINHAHSFFSRARFDNLTDIFVVAVNRGGISIAGVGLLAIATASLPLGLLAYHIYLIWAGMTTNESQKWSEWKEDMRDGYVFRANMDDLRHHNQRRQIRDTIVVDDETGQPNPALSGPQAQDEITWPISSNQILVRTNDGRPPRNQDGLWTRVWDMSEVDNIYDLGGAENFLQVLRGS